MQIRKLMLLSSACDVADSVQVQQMSMQNDVMTKLVHPTRFGPASALAGPT